MNKIISEKLTWISLLLFSMVIISCGGGGGGGGGGGAAAPGGGGGPAANNAPVLNALGAQAVVEGEGLAFTVSATDPDGDAVTLAATGLSGGATFDPATGSFEWVTAPGSAGTIDVTFTASDGSLMASQVVTITIVTRSTAMAETEAAGTSGGNDTSATAEILPTGFAATGDLSLAGDVDVWSVSATAGEVIKIELFGTRLDQQGWGVAATVPRLSLTDTDGTTVLLSHDQAAFLWGSHDLDIPRFRVPASGNYYLSVTQDNPLLAGGTYALIISTVDVGTLQMEAEASGTSGVNDSAATAEPIQAGTLLGYHTDLSFDFYSFSVATPSIACFEITAHRNGIADQVDADYTDLEMNLYDTDGATLMANSDDGFFFDPALCFGIETPGTYFLEVANFFGIGDGEYFLDFDLTGSAPGTGSGVLEVEPNDAPGTATSIAYGQIGIGAVDAGIGGDEADLYVFSGLAGDVVRIQQYDTINSQGALDSVSIELLAPDGVTVLPEDFDGPAGLQVTRTILQSSGNYFVSVSSLGIAGTTSYRFKLEMVKAATYETEPNNAIATANPLDIAGRGAGVIDVVGDEDVYSFSAAQGQVVNLSILADQAGSGDSSDGIGDFSGHGSLLEPVLTIRDAAGTVLSETTSDPAAALVTGESVTEGLATTGVTFIAPSAGTYTLTVAESRVGEGSADHYYIVHRD